MTHTDEEMERAQTARVISAADRVVASATALADAVERLDAPTLRDRLAAAEAANATLTAQVEEMRGALEQIADAPAWGAPDRWETTPAEVRQLARQALALPRGEG